MIDIIVSAILITFGLLSIYFSIENGISDPRLMLILVVGIVAVLAGSWILISTISIGVILQKIGALFMVGLGVFLVIGFPGVSEYQCHTQGAEHLQKPSWKQNHRCDSVPVRFSLATVGYTYVHC